MPLKDYKRFIKIAEKELPKDVYLDNAPASKHIAISFAKLRDAYSFYYEPSDSIRTCDPSGIYIDVFPYEEMPDLPLWMQKLIIKSCGCTWMRTRFFWNRAHGFFKGILFSALGGVFSLAHAIIRMSTWPLLRLLPGKYIYIGFERGNCKVRYEKSKMFPTVNHRFEDGEFPVPNDADSILKAQYGDWHWIPPPDQRPRHATIIDPFNAAVSPRSMEYPKDK